MTVDTGYLAFQYLCESNKIFASKSSISHQRPPLLRAKLRQPFAR
jgi:hypothetical protein